jgi:hypothetical protein
MKRKDKYQLVTMSAGKRKNESDEIQQDTDATGMISAPALSRLARQARRLRALSFRHAPSTQKLLVIVLLSGVALLRHFEIRDDQVRCCV